MFQDKEKTRMRKLLVFAVCGALALGAAACGDDDDDSGGGGGDLSGTIRIDGSSTVAPFDRPQRNSRLFMEGFRGSARR